MYSIDGLRLGIERCEHNIDVLKKAIRDERQTIADYKIMIDRIKRSERLKEEAQKNIHIEVVRSDEDDAAING